MPSNSGVDMTTTGESRQSPASRTISAPAKSIVGVDMHPGHSVASSQQQHQHRGLAASSSSSSSGGSGGGASSSGGGGGSSDNLAEGTSVYSPSGPKIPLGGYGAIGTKMGGAAPVNAGDVERSRRGQGIRNAGNHLVRRDLFFLSY